MQMDRPQILHQIRNLEHYGLCPSKLRVRLQSLKQITLLVVKAHHDFGQVKQEPYIATALQRFAMMIARKKLQHVQVAHDGLDELSPQRTLN